MISTTSPRGSALFRITLVPLVAIKSASFNLKPFTKTSTCPTVYVMEKVVCPAVDVYEVTARALAVEIPEVPALPDWPEDPEDPDPPVCPDDPELPDVPEEPDIPLDPELPLLPACAMTAH